MRFENVVNSILGSPAKVKVIAYLFKHSELPVSERELAKLTQVSHMSVNRTMKELQSLNVVSPRRIGKSSLWRLNRKSYTYKAILPFVKSISQINSPIEHLKKTIRESLPKKLIQKIILFGSVVKQKEDPTSDIDIFVLVKDEDAKQKLQPCLDKLSEKCQHIFGNLLAPYILTEKEFEQKKLMSLLKEIEKGEVVYDKDKDEAGTKKFL